MLRPALITCLGCFTSSEGLHPWKDDLRIRNLLTIVIEPCSWSQGRRPDVDFSLSLSLYSVCLGETYQVGAGGNRSDDVEWESR
jgi:hypothetical protein